MRGPALYQELCGEELVPYARVSAYRVERASGGRTLLWPSISAPLADTCWPWLAHAPTRADTKHNYPSTGVPRTGSPRKPSVDGMQVRIQSHPKPTPTSGTRTRLVPFRAYLCASFLLTPDSTGREVPILRSLRSVQFLGYPTLRTPAVPLS